MAKLKGNLIMGQSGGPTAVINSSLCGVVQEGLRHNEITGVYGMAHGIQGLLDEDIIDLGKEDPETIAGLRKTPSAALGSCRYKLKEDEYDQIVQIFKKYNIRYFVYNGGNDSMDTAYRVGEIAKDQDYELRCMGVPKTVDNDIGITDHCPGYGSVARWNAIATREAGRDTEAIGIVDNVKIIETMGRSTGWITASTALARDSEDSAPHLVYLPERVFDEESFLADVDRVYSRLGYCLITVCEGLKDKDGKYLTASDRALDTDKFGHKQLGGVADYLCSIIADNLKVKARFDKPGTVQRMSKACASRTDEQEAYLAGKIAVRKAVEGTSGYMITLVRESSHPYKCTTGLAPLQEVALSEKPVPDEYINEEGNFVTDKFIKYARPLIGDPLPEFVRLEKVSVEA